MKFGERLRAMREEKDLTRKALSMSSGVPFGTIHNYETGRRAPSFANVIAIANALGVTCETFSDCEDVNPANDARDPKPRVTRSAMPAPKKPRKGKK